MIQRRGCRCTPFGRGTAAFGDCEGNSKGRSDYILDEATAFTDPENEDKLQQSIDHLTKGKTLIVIAHRLSTIMYADKILVLEDGAISAEGTISSYYLLHRPIWICGKPISAQWIGV